MATQYSPLLKLALPVTGELSGTWGDVVNDNITSMIEQAVAGLATINTWTANSHTLTTANGTTSESRCAMLVAADGAGGTALTGAGEIICPATSKLYVVRNGSSYTVTLKTSAGTGIAVPTGQTTFLFCDGTNVNACVTTIVNGTISGNLTVNGNTTLGDSGSDTITATARFNTDLLPSTDNARDLGSSGNSWKDLWIDGTATIATLNVTTTNATTVDTTNIEVTNVKAKDGTSAATIADSTGVITLTANPIVNAGTANGVTYLNASKVLTSGSSLVFDGTNFSVTGSAYVRSGNELRVFNTGNTTYGSIKYDTGVIYNDDNSSGHFWQLGGLTRVRISAAGNVGIQSNTSAWNTNFRALQIGDGASFWGPSSGSPPVANVSANQYYDAFAANRYIVNGHATLYTQELGTHKFFNAPSGTTGGTITFTQAMTLDASGNLGIGNSTPTAKLDVNGTAAISGAVTLSGGTANGVVYLNASKVVTSGSALTFNGVSFGVSNIDLNNGGVQYFYSSGFGSYFALTNNANALTFGYNGSEQMRLTTTGLGIGTTSPGVKLDVSYVDSAFNPGIRVTNTSNTSASQAKVYAVNNVGDYISLGRNSTALGGQSSIFSTGAYPLQFFTNSTLQATLDASGNLGLGVTPSAWNGTYKVAQIGTLGALAGRTGTTDLLQLSENSYRDELGNYRYLSSQAASRYDQTAGQHQWFTAPSGTAGNAITFTQAMTLDASGNLGLGVVPSAWTSVYKVLQSSSGGSVAFDGFATSFLTANAYNDGSWKYVTSRAAGQYRIDNNTHTWYVAPSGTAGNAITFTQAMTLDARGNLLLGGTASPASARNSFALFNGTVPTGSVTDGCVLYTEDVSSSSELKVRDEAGNITTLSPHNFDLIPEGPSEDMAWSYYSERDGKRINVDMLKAIRLLEKLSGEQLVYESK